MSATVSDFLEWLVLEAQKGARASLFRAELALSEPVSVHVPGLTHGYHGVGLASSPGSQQSSGGWRLGSLRLRMLEMENGLADLAALDSVVSAMPAAASGRLRAARSCGRSPRGLGVSASGSRE
ncbi:hypothetical protein HPB52_019173 [Rhipicephalus sanguineus]|uniref:Uncharacterized protein n=1 Tax=Rhipicephalus sanguineus TaxID=34632 RepID=A0A9D4YQJ7_RHISA|nr:hypothetical protein HPB52_019173 [Rhipicephalus sanguineus]